MPLGVVKVEVEVVVVVTELFVVDFLRAPAAEDTLVEFKDDMDEELSDNLFKL
jgi:hypothetical protein